MNLHDHYIFEDGASISTERLMQELCTIDARAQLSRLAQHSQHPTTCPACRDPELPSHDEPCQLHDEDKA